MMRCEKVAMESWLMPIVIALAGLAVAMTLAHFGRKPTLVAVRRRLNVK